MRALLFILGLLAAVPAQAQTKLLQAHAATATFTGPGDIVSGATAFYSFRGYSAAYASTGTGKSMSVRRASDNATQDIVILTSGAFDIASYNTFVGTDATCTGSMVGTTTLTISGCASGTIHVNDPISGTGIVQPAYITVIGTCGAGAGSCTVNAAQTFGSTTVTAQLAGFIPKAYDQSGNVNDSSNATAANQPHVLPLCFGASQTLPCARWNANIFLSATITATAFTTMSESIVAQRTGNFSSFNGMSNLGVGGSQAALSGFGNATNTALIYAGTIVTKAATDSTTHAIQAVFNGASSVISVDGSATTVNPGAVGASQTTLQWGDTSNGPTALGAEMGLWPSVFNATVAGTGAGSMCNNQLYWGAFGC